MTADIMATLENAEQVAPLPEDCPVQPLGHLDGKYYFLSPTGELRVFRYNELTYNGILSLFDGYEFWLIEHFPHRKKRTKNSKFDSDNLVVALITACRIEGHFDPATKPRGPGVWESGDPDFGLIVHNGDHLYYGGERHAAGKRIGRAIYTAHHKVEGLADRPATQEETRVVYDTLRLWKYQTDPEKLDPQLMDVGPMLITGFIAQAMLGGAHRWRAHMMVTGKTGSGKTHLSNAVVTALGGAAQPMMNNFTQAALYQSFTGEARCFVLDEAEHDEQQSRVKAVIEILRQMSTGDGASIRRGSAAGQAMDYSVTGSAFLSSILHVPLTPQDRSRITHLQLAPLGESVNSEQVRALEQQLKRLKELSPFLRRRVIDMWPEFQARFMTYHAYLMNKIDLDSRNADQLSTLLAGQSVMLRDDPPDESLIKQEVTLIWEIIGDIKRDKKDGEGQQCLMHLMTAITDVMRDGSRMSIGQLIEEVFSTYLRNDRRALESYGVKVIKALLHDHRAKDQVVIANRGGGLDRIFSGTRWAGGAWSQALMMLDDAEKVDKSFKFAGINIRGTVLPSEIVEEIQKHD